MNVKFHNNGSVSYETQKFYFFERNASVGSEDDVITTLNIPMMVSFVYLKRLHKKSYFKALLSHFHNVLVFLKKIWL